MPVTQREYDLMQAQAQIHIMKIVDEWRSQFLGGRMQAILGGQAPLTEEPEDTEELPIEGIPYG